MSENSNTQLTIIDRSIDTFKKGSEILRKNQDRAGKALIVGNRILEAIAANGGKLSPELDDRCQKFLANCSGAKTEMNQERAAITQIMDEIKKLYTAEENKLDYTKAGTVPSQIQAHRDMYAKECAMAEKRKQEEAAEATRVAKLKIDYKYSIAQAIITCLIEYLAKKKRSINDSFAGITLVDFDARSEALKNMKTFFPEEKLPSILDFSLPPGSPEIDREALHLEARNEFNYDAFYKQYDQQLTELKQQLIDRLTSKKAELEEIEIARVAAEKAKQDELAKQREADLQRQVELEKTKNEEDRKRQEEVIEAARKADAERLAAMEQQAEEERIRKENEIRAREEAGAARLASEDEKHRRAAEVELEMNKQAEHTMSLFNQEAAVSYTTKKPEAREGYDIVINHPAGCVQIFQFWWETEGKNLPIDKMLKTSIGQMKSFCEKHAQKTSTKIESKFLTYNETFKSINRSVKVA